MKWILVVMAIIAQTSCAVNHRVMVGDEPVIIQQTKGQGKTFVHVHHNEQTALKAAKAVIRKEGGSLITLIHSGGRNIVFHLNNQRYEFDPNRIFTDKGIKKTLAQYSYYTPEAHQEVKKLADKIKALLPEGKVIAVHNNSSYSLKDYLPGHELAKDAKALYMNPDNYFRNFYLVTKLSDYLRLKMQGFNGVLQKPSATDDGSLSVYLAKRDYINVEAGYDQLAEQIKMLLHA
ncbi:TPA: protein tyrosine phosphatase [Legionella pneumophila]|uniref:Protein tyrosine phosphatase n=1 Tax=Legionella pneumophila TaxID=446 RepID=A0AAN5KP97_LEGPN|nr:protein tyrosine phosphatase [Legionella pneumophila]HAT1970623.1 protein tyrosine phosphatase [Legionella pneumophila]HAT6955348.1 protein tyrosine phosphatase [Legionella pneumophila]HEN4769296.1 protein tyrosine phosphatase [Legionella pneumophila]